MAFLVVIAYMIIAFFDLIPLYKQKKKKDLIVNAGLTGIGFIIVMLLSMGIDIPSPAKAIEAVIKLLIE